MQYIRAFLTFLHILLGLALLVLTGSLWNPHSNLVKQAKRWWLKKIISLIGIQVEVRGTPPTITNNQSLVYISNHVSWVDIPVIGSQQTLYFLSKAEVKDWPLIGRLAKGTGTLFIRRGSGDSLRVVDQIANYVKAGHSVLFFPEGTTTNGRSVNKFHPKLFKISELTEVNYCPIVLSYHVAGRTDNPVAFIDDDEFTPHLWNLFGLKKITAIVEFLPVQQIDPNNINESVLALETQAREHLSKHPSEHGDQALDTEQTC